MPKERLERPSKGARKHIREVKSRVRHEIDLTGQVDSRIWNDTIEILRLELPDFEKKVAPHLTIVYEFFELRQKIREGGSVNVIDDFYHKHGKELIQELAPAFMIVRRILTPKR